jgi:hypothetical protein
MLAGAGAQLYQASQRPDPPSVNQPDKYVEEVRPGVKKVRERQGDKMVTRTVRSPEVKQERQEREQMIDELFNAIGTTDDERQQQFEEAKQTFIENFEETVEPKFEEQRDELRAQQEATGRSISTAGQAERENLKEEHQQTLQRNRQQADMMARDLQKQEDQRNLNLIQQLESGLNARTAQEMRASQNLGAQHSQTLASEKARIRAQQSANKIQRQQDQALSNTVGVLAGGASDYFNLPEKLGVPQGDQPQSQFTGDPGAFTGGQSQYGLPSYSSGVRRS